MRPWWIGIPTAAWALSVGSPGSPHETLEVVGPQGLSLLLRSVHFDQPFVDWATSQAYLVRSLFCPKSMNAAWVKRLTVAITEYPRLVSLWNDSCMKLALRSCNYGIPLLGKIAEHRDLFDYSIFEGTKVCRKESFFVQLFTLLAQSRGFSIAQGHLTWLLMRILPITLEDFLEKHAETALDWYELFCQPEQLRLFLTYDSAKLLRPLLIVPTGLRKPSQRRKLAQYPEGDILARWLMVEWALWYLLEHYEPAFLGAIELMAAWLRNVPKVNAFAPLAPLWQMGTPSKLKLLVNLPGEPWAMAVAKLPYGNERPDSSYLALYDKLVNGNSAMATTRHRLRFLARLSFRGQTKLLKHTLAHHQYNPEDIMQLWPWMSTGMKTSLVIICANNVKLWHHILFLHPMHAALIPKRWRLPLLRDWLRNRVAWQLSPAPTRLPRRLSGLVEHFEGLVDLDGRSNFFERGLHRRHPTKDGQLLTVAQIYERLVEHARTLSLIDERGEWASLKQLNAKQGDLVSAMATVLAMAVINGEPIQLRPRSKSEAWRALSKEFHLFLPFQMPSLSDRDFVRLLSSE